MEKEQIIKEINDKLDAFKGEMKQYVSKEDLNTQVEALKSEVAKLDNSDLVAKMKEVEDACFKQGEAIAKMKETSKATKNIASQLKDQSEIIDRIQKGDYTAKATVLPTSVSQANTGMTLAEIGQIQTRANQILSLFTQSGIASNNQRTITYLEQTTRTSAAAARTIGTAAAESTLAWTKADLAIKSYSHIIPVALEMLNDYDFIQSEINNFLLNDLLLAVESDAYNGAGTTNLLKGILTSATAWVDPNIDFVEAGLIELIQTCATQISQNTKFKANAVLLNPYDALQLKLAKSDLGQYLFPNFMGNDGMMLEGMKIIATPLVTANTMLVGDFTQATLYSRPASIQVGLNGTDFAERQVSILANIDVALLVKSTQEGAFVKVTANDTAISAITQGA